MGEKNQGFSMGGSYYVLVDSLDVILSDSGSILFEFNGFYRLKSKTKEFHQWAVKCFIECQEWSAKYVRKHYQFEEDLFRRFLFQKQIIPSENRTYGIRGSSKESLGNRLVTEF